MKNAVIVNRVRSKKELARLLDRILYFYESQRSILGKDKSEAKKRTLEAYDDLYDWLNRLGDFEEVAVKKHDSKKV